MSRLLQPFILTLTALIGLTYWYVASSLGLGTWARVAWGAPFFLVWFVPAFYWTGILEGEGSWLDKVVHQASYLCMAWVSFLVSFTLLGDLAVLGASLLLLEAVHGFLATHAAWLVLGGSFAALGLGTLNGLRGPSIEHVRMPIADLHPDLEGYRIVQISDLHVGNSIGRRYVERTVAKARGLGADLVAMTGDMVDGSVEALAPHVAPLAADCPAYFVLGNHDCYSGAAAWSEKFRQLGARVLLNEHTSLRKGAATIVVGGVVDPAYRDARPAISLEGAPRADLRLLLAHNPKLAPLGARAGFDLQLSGHTHAGQFFPWTLAVRMVHAPHVAGLSREGRMQVYVSAGTGSWGPPVRLGTCPEISMIELVRA